MLGFSYKKNALAQINLKVDAWYGVRTPLEKPLYELALKHAANAEASRKGGYQAEASRKRFYHKDELEHTVLTVILAAAFMEAFINQQGIELLGQDFHKYDEGYIDVYGNAFHKKRGYPKLEHKWSEITERLSNKQFDKGAEPFQGFKKLVELRNKTLHYKGMPDTPAPSPWPDVSGSVTPERAEFNATAAQYSIKSMQGMLRKFSTLTSKVLPNWIK
jgi:hypothetical protein